MKQLLTEEIANRLAFQFHRELHAFYSYLGIAAWCDLNGFENLSKWFLHQANEEKEHAEKVFDYLLSRDSKINFVGIPSSKSEFVKLAEAVRWALELEIQVEKDYQELAQLSLEKKDYTTHEFVMWFLKEQVEEIRTFKSLLDQVELIGDNLGNLILFDRTIQIEE